MENKKVSVIIPCYNSEEFIRECVESVISQTYNPKEIIIVDDASTDNSLKIITWLSAQNTCIKVMHLKTNVGECKASAIGFSLATGDYLCRLSSDDVFIRNDHLANQVAFMEQNNLDWCYNNINRIGSTFESSQECYSSWVPAPVRNSAEVLWVFDNSLLKFPRVCYLIAIRKNPVNSSAFMIRGNTYRRLLSWDSDSIRSCCDGLLLGKILLLGLRGMTLHTLGSFYRIHPNQATGKPETNLALKTTRDILCTEFVNKHNTPFIKFIVRIIHDSY